MSYVGIEDCPVGIRVTTYDPLKCEERGLFITIEDRLYKKTTSEIEAENILSNGEKKRTKKFKDNYAINTQFHISNILNSFGWKILLDVIQVVEDSVNQIYYIQGPSISSDKTSSMYRMETLIHPASISNHFKSELQSFPQPLIKPIPSKF